MRKIFFGSMEEHNKRRQEEFLAMKPEERLLWFIHVISHPTELTKGKAKDKSKDNFILRRKDDSI